MTSLSKVPSSSLIFSLSKVSQHYRTMCLKIRFVEKAALKPNANYMALWDRSTVNTLQGNTSSSQS